MSLRFRLFEFGSRLFIKAPMRLIKKPTHLRAYLDFVTRLNSGTPRGAKFEQIMLNAEGKNVPALKVLSDQGQSQRILLYVHGGGYLFGSSDVYKGMVTHMVRRLGFDAVIPDYALAPENPFPAGFNDVVASYLGLLKMGFDSHQISLMGDSAGGNLICSLLDSSAAVKAAGRHPTTGINFPSKDNSPMATWLSAVSAGIMPIAASRAKAIGKSKWDPIFGKSAGDMLIVIFFDGIAKPIDVIAERTLSRASLTALSGSPTI